MSEESNLEKTSESTLNLEGLTEIISPDSQEELLSQYNNFKKVAAGEIISDVSLAWESLCEWMPISQAESLIPFTFKKKKGPLNRIWILSRQKGTRFYSGQWFDLKVSNTSKRQRIKACRLNSNAIEVFKNNPQIKENV